MFMVFHTAADFFSLFMSNINKTGPVVQSIVSLTSTLRGQFIKCFTTLLPNTVIFLLKKKRQYSDIFVEKKT